MEFDNDYYNLSDIIEREYTVDKILKTSLQYCEVMKFDIVNNILHINIKVYVYKGG